MVRLNAEKEDVTRSERAFEFSGHHPSLNGRLVAFPGLVFPPGGNVSFGGAAPGIIILLVVHARV